ncbi:hypothetical protein [Streptomyces sp. NPDC004286]|uniref:hypothetical protein n=1 Tax=Streptomyces sp. NPDC004286 TaxID=3364696 RepID=UPI0036BB0EAE
MDDELTLRGSSFEDLIRFSDLKEMVRYLDGEEDDEVWATREALMIFHFYLIGERPCPVFNVKITTGEVVNVATHVDECAPCQRAITSEDFRTFRSPAVIRLIKEIVASQRFYSSRDTP